MANIPDTENTAKMKKRLGRENNAQLGLFTKPDGSKCTPTESAEQMILTHFPNSLPRPPHTVRRPLAEEVDITDPKADFINPISVKTCIESFKTFKGAGPSNLKPFFYKHLGPLAIQRMCNIIKASYLLGVMPECFKELRVVFIPKLNKPSFELSGWA